VREHLAVEPTGRDCTAADVQREVLSLTAKVRPGAVGPINVDRVEGASSDVGTEVRMPTALGEVVEHGADGRVGCTSLLAERHGDVEAMDHDVVERAVVAAPGRRPAVRHFLAQVPDELAGRQLRVAGRDAVRESREVERVLAQLGSEYPQSADAGQGIRGWARLGSNQRPEDYESDAERPAGAASRVVPCARSRASCRLRPVCGVALSLIVTTIVTETFALPEGTRRATAEMMTYTRPTGACGSH